VGLISSAAPIMMAVSSPIWGLIADRRGRKLMLVRAMLGGSLMLGLSAAVTSVPQLAALRILQGALTGTIAAAVTLVATSVPREQCGFALGLLQSAVFVGSSLGPSVGGLIGGTLGYRVAFLGSGILLLGAGILVVFLVHERFEPPPPQKQDGNALLLALRSIAAEPILLSMVALLMLNSLAGSVTSPILPLYVQTLVANVREASTATGMILGVTAVANALAAVLIGRSASRLGQRRVLLLCVGAASLVSFPQMLTRTPGQLLALRALMGFAMGSVSPIANSIIAERAPEGHQGGIYGTSTSLNAAGSAVGPMIGSLIATHWGIAGVFPATGALLGVVVLIVAAISRSLGRVQPAARRARRTR
jgi:DHA1 family multidrug resistance protein-like MFS transporter